MSSPEGEEDNPEVILSTYKSMVAECQQLSSKVAELTLERDEHKLVLEQLTKLEGDRKAFRLIGGVLVERTVADVLPPIQQNYEGVRYR
jgi:prefoldin subunit 2